MTDGSPIATLHLNDLCQNKPERPGWSLTFGATCAEAAAVCLKDQGHSECIADDSDTLFQRKARLEVSGIRKGSEAIIQSRVNMKLKQIAPSDSVAPGYVAVVEFGTPKTRIVEKCRT